jgi:hypothetical protein
MYPPQPVPAPSPGQVPVPSQVRTAAVMIWLTVALASVIFAINMAAVPFAGVAPGYAFGYSLPWIGVAALLGVTAIPLVRGRSWARAMAKVVLIVQIVLQSLMLLSGTGFLWALFLLPMAITALIQLRHPMSRWFFGVHDPNAHPDHARQHPAAHYPQHPHQQMHPGYQPHQYPTQPHQPHQYPTHPHPRQGYGQQPPPYGSWDQNHRQQ